MVLILHNIGFLVAPEQYTRPQASWYTSSNNTILHYNTIT